MSDDLIRTDTAALMLVHMLIIEALECDRPGIKQVMAETIQDAIDKLSDQVSEHSMKATLQKFHEMMARNNPLDSLLH